MMDGCMRSKGTEHILKKRRRNIRDEKGQQYIYTYMFFIFFFCCLRVKERSKVEVWWCVRMQLLVKAPDEPGGSCRKPALGP